MGGPEHFGVVKGGNRFFSGSKGRAEIFEGHKGRGTNLFSQDWDLNFFVPSAQLLRGTGIFCTCQRGMQRG